MTEVIDTEVLESELVVDPSIHDALELIDAGLGDISDRNLVPTSEVADLLLDVRGVLARLDAVSTN